MIKEVNLFFTLVNFNDIVFMGNHYFLNASGDGIYKMEKSIEQAPERCLEHKGSSYPGRTIRVLQEENISLLALNESDSKIRLVKVNNDASSFEVLNFDDVIISLKDHQFSGLNRLTVLDDPEIRVYSFNFIAKKVEKTTEWKIPIDLNKQEVATTLAIDPFFNNYCVQTEGLGGIASRILVLGLKNNSFVLKSTFNLMDLNIGDVRAMAFIGYYREMSSLVCVSNKNNTGGQGPQSLVLNLKVSVDGSCADIGQHEVNVVNIVRLGNSHSQLIAFGSDMRELQIMV